MAQEHYRSKYSPLRHPGVHWCFLWVLSFHDGFHFPSCQKVCEPTNVEFLLCHIDGVCEAVCHEVQCQRPLKSLEWRRQPDGLGRVPSGSRLGLLWVVFRTNILIWIHDLSWLRFCYFPDVSWYVCRWYVLGFCKWQKWERRVDSSQLQNP